MANDLTSAIGLMRLAVEERVEDGEGDGEGDGECKFYEKQCHV